jgi:hypothetical protein
MSIFAGRARAHAEIARVLTLRNETLSEIGPDGFPVPGPVPSTTDLRFPIGAEVLCHCQKWERAIIVKHWYREANWVTGK